MQENATRNLNGVSELMYLRRYLVDWMALTCQKFRLTANSQHLAVTLYDHFTDLYSVTMEDLKVLVICCLQVASEYSCTTLYKPSLPSYDCIVAL